MRIDTQLALALERAEGMLNASFVEVRQKVSAHNHALAQNFGGTYAAFDGQHSPISQTFGFGLSGEATAEWLRAMEVFFSERGTPTTHEISPLTGISVSNLLIDRSYRPVDYTSVLVQSVTNQPDQSATSASFAVKIAEPKDAEKWVRTTIEGWSGDPEAVNFIKDFAVLAFLNPVLTNFWVEREGAPIATGSLGVCDRVAVLAGASTVPAFRGQGAQNALLRARLQLAHQRGCALAIMGAAPGSTSEHNAHRNGFATAYTRIKWQRAAI